MISSDRADESLNTYSQIENQNVGCVPQGLIVEYDKNDKNISNETDDKDEGKENRNEDRNNSNENF